MNEDEEDKDSYKSRGFSLDKEPEFQKTPSSSKKGLGSKTLDRITLKKATVDGEKGSDSLYQEKSEKKKKSSSSYISIVQPDSEIDTKEKDESAAGTTQTKTKRSIKEIGGAISDRLATQMGSWQEKTNLPGIVSF